MTKNVFIKIFTVSIFNNFGGSLIKLERNIVNTILWQPFNPVSQTPVVCKEFGLFVSNTSNKVPLVVLKRVGVLIKFVRLKVSTSSEKWLSISLLDSDTSIFKFPASCLTYCFWYFLKENLLIIFRWRINEYNTPFPFRY